MNIELVTQDLSIRARSEIEKAEREILLSTVFFTDRKTMFEFISLFKKGCSIIIIISRDERNFFSWTDLIEVVRNGVQIYQVEDSESSPEKFCVIDNKLVLWGSYNWSHDWKSEAERFHLEHASPEKVVEFVNRFENRKRKGKLLDINTIRNLSSSSVYLRLEILRNFILLKDDIGISRTIEDLKKYAFNLEISEIIMLVKNRIYTETLNKIETFLQVAKGGFNSNEKEIDF